MTSILFVSDAHVGSTVGLCRPVNDLDDGGQYKASPGQSWLSRCWDETIEWATRSKHGDLITVFDGDMAEGDFKSRSAQVITRNPANVVTIVTKMIEPLAEASTALFFIRGTAAHVGPSASLEETIARNFDNTIYCPENGAASWWWLPLDIEGVRLDVAHHPGIGVSKSPFAKFNGINQLAARAVFSYADAGKPIPHLLIRAHNHTHRDSLDAYRTRAITLPAWTLATEYIHKIEPGALADIGAVLVNISAGHYEVLTKKFTPAQRSLYSFEELKYGQQRSHA